MHRVLVILTALVSTAGCASSWTDMGGTLLGQDFTHPRGAYFGAKYLVITDSAVGCQGVGWVERNLTAGPEKGDAPSFTGLLLASDAEFAASTEEHALAPATIEGFAVRNSSAGFEVEPAREGGVTFATLDAGVLEGTLWANFAFDGVGGEFHAERCMALDR